MGKVLKENTGITEAKKGLKQVADSQRIALLHRYFSLMCNLTTYMYTNTAHQTEVGMYKCSALDISNLFQSFAIPPFLVKLFPLQMYLLAFFSYTMKCSYFCACCIMICYLPVSYLSNTFAHIEGPPTFVSIQKQQVSLTKPKSIQYVFVEK